MEEARNRMFIDISHDLKTPVTVISGYSRSLAENMVRTKKGRKGISKPSTANPCMYRN